MARREGRIEGSILCAALLLVVAPAKAYELSGGVGLGGILVGTLPRFTVSPHAAIAWRRERFFVWRGRALQRPAREWLCRYDFDKQ